MEITGEARAATPKHEWAAALARALMGARQGLNFALNWPGGGLGDLLIGKAPEGWEKVSYGDYPYGFAEPGLGDRLPRLRRGRAEEVVDMASTLPIGAVAKGGAPAIAGAIRLKGDILTPDVAKKIVQDLTPQLEERVDPAFADRFRTSLARFLTRKGGEEHPLMNSPAWVNTPFDSHRYLYPEFASVAIKRDLSVPLPGSWGRVFDSVLGSHFEEGIERTRAARAQPELVGELAKGTGLTAKNFAEILRVLPEGNIIVAYNTARPEPTRARDVFEALARRLSNRRLGNDDFLSMIAGDRKVREELAKALKSKGSTTIMKFGNGWKWEELGPRDLKREGRLMRHCSGSRGYVEGCAEGQIRMFSLRDDQGKPQVTIDAYLNPDGTFRVNQILGYKNTVPYDLFDKIKSLIKAHPELDVEWSDDYINLERAWRQRNAPNR